MARSKKRTPQADLQTTAANPRTLEVTDTGPIASMRVDLPEGGGVVVGLGPNGAGKSTIIDAAAALAGDKKALKRLTPRDGSAMGTVRLGDVMVTVGRSTKPHGQLEIQSLAGRVDVSKVVDPGIVDPVIRDEHRLRAIAGLAANDKTVRELIETLNAKLRAAFITGIDCDASTSDVLDVAEAARRQANRYALAAEEEASQHRTQAGTLEGIAQELGGPPSPVTPEETEAAQAELRDAVRDVVACESAIKSNEAAEAAAIAARSRLAALGVSGNPAKDLIDAAARMDHAKACWRDAQEAERSAKAAYETAFAEWERAEHVSKVTAEATKAIEAATAHIPHGTQTHLQAALCRQASARDALIALTERQRNAERSQKAMDLLAKASALDARAAERRAIAGRGIDEEIEAIVQRLLPTLQVIDGRLFIQTKRGLTYFDDLSTGERWRFALELAARACPLGLVPVCQEAWESLDFEHRNIVAALAREMGCVILTAEADSNNPKSSLKFYMARV